MLQAWESRIQARLEDPNVGSNLLDFLQRNGLDAVLDGDRVVEMEAQSRELQLAEVTLLVRVWQIVDPEKAIEINPPAG